MTPKVDQRLRLAKLVELADSEIDVSDIPEAPAENRIRARCPARQVGGTRGWTN